MLKNYISLVVKYEFYILCFPYRLAAFVLRTWIIHNSENYYFDFKR